MARKRQRRAAARAKREALPAGAAPGESRRLDGVRLVVVAVTTP